EARRLTAIHGRCRRLIAATLPSRIQRGRVRTHRPPIRPLRYAASTTSGGNCDSHKCPPVDDPAVGALRSCRPRLERKGTVARWEGRSPWLSGLPAIY